MLFPWLGKKTFTHVGVGVPFHPEGQRPRAACPVCIEKRKDSSNKALYPIMGLWPGQYDEDIPKEYFILHPLQLNEPGNENIRVS